MPTTIYHHLPSSIIAFENGEVITVTRDCSSLSITHAPLSPSTTVYVSNPNNLRPTGSFMYAPNDYQTLDDVDIDTQSLSTSEVGDEPGTGFATLFVNLLKTLKTFGDRVSILRRVIGFPASGTWQASSPKTTA